ILNEESGDVTSYSKQYQLNPQTTTYLQVASSPEGSPILQNIPESEALLLLRQSTRQNHQISRVLSNCNG
ncbi:OmpA family protein, partial [Psychrobacter sp. AOP7-D1-15]